jgi:hypothetical protein
LEDTVFRKGNPTTGSGWLLTAGHHPGPKGGGGEWIAQPLHTSVLKCFHLVK